MKAVDRHPELLCPNCEYNLKGLPENRCPECGEAFDPEALRLAMLGVPQPVWPSERIDQFEALHKVWWTTIRRPREFAKRFPPVHSVGHAVIYSCACYAVAIVLFLLVFVLALSPPASTELSIAFSIVLGSLFAIWFCETVIAAVLAVLLKPTRAIRPYHFWRGLTHFTSGFVILTSLCVGVCIFVLLYVFEGSPIPFEGTLAIWAVGFMVFLWWIVTLNVMIVARSHPGPRQWVASVIVSLVGAVSVLAGVVTSVFVAVTVVM